jgi:hypothetical protein
LWLSSKIRFYFTGQPIKAVLRYLGKVPPVMQRLILSLFLLLLVSHAFGQKFLAVENPGRFKRVLFKPGEAIRFQMDDGKAVYTGRIESISDSIMVIISSVVVENEGDATRSVQRDYVQISRISTVFRRPDKSDGTYLIRIISGGLMIFGSAMLVIIPVNSVTTGVDIEPGTMFLAGGMAAAGALLQLGVKNKYRIGKKWKVRSMEAWDEVE